MCYIHRRHLFLLSPKALTHFAIPWTAEGRVDLGGWLHTKMVYLPAVTHSGINRAQHRATTLIGHNVLTTTPCQQPQPYITVNKYVQITVFVRTNNKQEK